jgi:GNAT superfamily N-acetyltransferase
MKSGEEQEVASLVRQVFYDHVAPHYSSAGVQQFLRYADPQAMAGRAATEHWVLVAEEDAKILAMIELREHHHVSMLFVASGRHRQGIGGQLLRKALSICQKMRPGLDAVWIHASPNALIAYERLGFRAHAPEQIITGIRFTPMRLQLDAMLRD